MTVTSDQIAKLRDGLQRAQTAKAQAEGRRDAARAELDRAMEAMREFGCETVEELDGLAAQTAADLDQVLAEAREVQAELERLVPA